MPSILQRLQNAANGFLGRESRSIAPIDVTYAHGYGMSHGWKPRQSLEAYGDNVWLYGAVTKIAFEVAGTKFKLQKVSAKGEVE